MRYTIRLRPTPITEPCEITITVPKGKDPEQYINDYLEFLLTNEFVTRVEWEFVQSRKEGKSW